MLHRWRISFFPIITSWLFWLCRYCSLFVCLLPKNFPEFMCPCRTPAFCFCLFMFLCQFDYTNRTCEESSTSRLKDDIPFNSMFMSFIKSDASCELCKKSLLERQARSWQKKTKTTTCESWILMKTLQECISFLFFCKLQCGPVVMFGSADPRLKFTNKCWLEYHKIWKIHIPISLRWTLQCLSSIACCHISSNLMVINST